MDENAIGSRRDISLFQAEMLIDQHRKVFDMGVKIILDTVERSGMEVYVDHPLYYEKPAHIRRGGRHASWFKLEEKPEVKFFYHDVTSMFTIGGGFLHIVIKPGNLE